MKQYVYPFLCAALPSLVTSLGLLMPVVFMSVFCTDKASCLLRWIVTNAFPSCITKKKDNGVTRWFFGDIDLTTSEELLSKVLSSLSALFLMLFFVASNLFWSTLLLDITTSCKPNDHTIECFKNDVKENVKFWKAFSRLSDDPIDCNSAEFQNESADVICYQIVFNIGAACGAGYGAFKLAVIILNAATTLMMLHQRSRSVKRTRIIIGLSLTAIYVALVVSGVVESNRGSAIVKPDSQGVVLVLQFLMLFFLGIIFVFFVPWNELVTLRNNMHLYEPIV